MTNLVEFPAGGALRLRVAEEVRALMGRRRMSQAQLGAVLKISQVSVSERLRGKTPFTLDDLERLALLPIRSPIGRQVYVLGASLPYTNPHV